MKHLSTLLLAAMLCGTRAAAQPLSVEIENPTQDFRLEIVELDGRQVAERVGQGFRVLDAAGLDVPFQKTHDDKLLIEVAVRQGGKARFRIVEGRAPEFRKYCHGALHPERKDDLAWENDRGAYRVYGPALGRTGERSYGVDVWTKNTPELVVDSRYYIEDVVTIPHIDTLYRDNWHKRDSVYRTISYHYDHGEGLDPYRVGPTLGCGAPALMLGDSIVMPRCFADYEILDNGPLRFKVHLTYAPVEVDGCQVREHRIIQLDKQSNFNRCTVWYEGLTHAVGFCSGVVLQKEDMDSYVLGQGYVSYTDPTDQPNVHQAPLYVAALFPEGEVKTRLLGNHALGQLANYTGTPYSYYFGSAWAKYDVRTPEEWQSRIAWFMRSLKSPLIVTCK